ncbi:hypothetical protein DSO06_03745 [Candidatus Nezhaarchaeota archaeon WYZ-LMO8]|nr:MAG: hypothetical protein DSO06_03745 [Candidatus Nezhaarchaeota archaeon WYZ-LMO8]TDA35866.1 MAG: hypothetical protein DSO05_04590 [Candidatus Nezhaarchaeota archaeon WYZ-LMO7]
MTRHLALKEFLIVTKQSNNRRDFMLELWKPIKHHPTKHGTILIEVRGNYLDFFIKLAVEAV